MDIKKLNKEELLQLKEDIQSQLNYIDTLKVKIKTSKNKSRLLDLQKDDQIFCIDFNGSKIHHMDYVKINFNKKPKIGFNEDWTDVSAAHDTKPMGCSTSIKDECMYNHYFLCEFCSSMHFYTLKPENWKIDLKLEQDRLIKFKRKIFNENIKEFKDKINNLIKSNNVNKIIKDYLK
jgi:hypothetical protein